MPHSYTPEYPTDVPVAAGIKTFFEDFYQRSDIPGEHEKYADFFTDNATIFVGSRNAVGREGDISIPPISPAPLCGGLEQAF